MTTNLFHCLYHCAGYAAEAVDKRAGYCLVCLYPGHTAGACKNAMNPKNVCSKKGCQKHHHPSLHGAKDRYRTSVNILKVTSMRKDDTKDITSVWSPTSVAKSLKPGAWSVHPGQHNGEQNLRDVRNLRQEGG